MITDKNIRRFFKTLSYVLFAACCGLILWFTIFSRPEATTRHTVLGLFASFRSLFAGEASGRTEAIQNLINILFFIPYGFFFPEKKGGWQAVALYGALFAVLIEVTQYVFILGWAEVDDVLSNTIGAVIGFFLWFCLHKLLTKSSAKSHPRTKH